MIWHLTTGGLIVLITVAALALLGLHMIVQPQIYVGRGPIPAGSARNVRAMGMLFALFGGIVTATFTAPIFLLS